MFPRRSRTTTRRRFSATSVAICAMAATLLAACADSPTAPDVPSVRVRKDVICVQRNSNGDVINTQPVNEHGQCADGFDLQIWM